ncbi:MAG: glycine cleavage system protein GcvH [Armatimonadota bacterium]
MNVPEDLKYTHSHEWARAEGELVRIGITDHAQAELQDITYLELPDIGAELRQGEPFGIIESVKTVADLNMPIGGEIAEVNTALAGDLDVVSNDPYGDGWIIAVRPSSPEELDALLDAAAYRALLEKEA